MTDGMTADGILDIMAIPARGDPSIAVRRVSIPAHVPDRACDVLIVGGGTGGVAAALATARHGKRAIVLEETDWIGGQLTTQGVSALDEHEHIEAFGGTATYYRLREAIRDHYLATYPAVRDVPELNPGRSWVTRLAFEPRVAVGVLWDLIRSAPESVRPAVEVRTKVVAVEVGGDEVRGVVAVDLDTATFTRYVFKRIIDATEFGDFLGLAGVESVVGAETQEATGEAHALTSAACRDCVQSLTYPAALRLASSDRGVSEAPPRYQHYRDSQPYGLRIHVTGGEIYSDESGWLEYDLFERLPGTKGGLWDYRRLIDRDFLGAPAEADISIINWPGNDYRDRSLLTLEPADQAHALQAAKWVSLGFVHWLQTEAPDRTKAGRRNDLVFAPDVYDTPDALPKHPYIRESRRLLSLRRIIESDVSTETQHGPAAGPMEDSVGVGWYPIDIHAAHANDQAVSLTTRPFQIPLGALIPIRVKNLLAGAKNIGTTHITNGCYRLHPVEWNVGEAAGTAAAISIDRDAPVQALVADEELLRHVQATLIGDGVPLDWILDVGPSHPAFVATQRAVLSGRLDPRDFDLKAQRFPAAERRRLGVAESA